MLVERAKGDRLLSLHLAQPSFLLMLPQHADGALPPLLLSF